jgi:cytochrome P450
VSAPSGSVLAEGGFNPFLPEVIDDPYPVYRSLRTREPVHYSKTIRSFVLTRHADVLAFFGDPRLSSDRTKARKYKGGPRQSAGTFQTDPPQHTRVRALVTKAFTPRVIASMATRIEAVVEDLLDRMERSDSLDRMGGEADVMAELAYPLPMTVISEILGVPSSDHERLHRWGRSFAEATDHHYSGRSQGTAAMEMAAYFAEIVPHRRLEPAEDLVSSLAAVSEGGDSLSEAEVIEVLVALLFAGHETTVNLIGNGLLALRRHPTPLARPRDEVGAERTGVEELLRYESPAQIISRTATEEMTLHDAKLEPGDSVVALLGAANRDPEVFEAPDPHREMRDPKPPHELTPP